MAEASTVGMVKKSLMLLVIIFCSFICGIKASECVYWLADPDGEEESKLLYKLGVNITIYGEWTYQASEDYYSPCLKIQPKMIRNLSQWVSMTSVDSTLRECCNHHIYECLQHHSPHESGEEFVFRVLNTCSTFRGKINEILCSQRNGHRSNVVNRVKVVSHDRKVENVSKIGCDTFPNISYITPLGEPLILGNLDTIYIDIDRGTVSNLSPQTVCLKNKP